MGARALLLRQRLLNALDGRGQSLKSGAQRLPRIFSYAFLRTVRRTMRMNSVKGRARNSSHSGIIVYVNADSGAELFNHTGRYPSA